MKSKFKIFIFLLVAFYFGIEVLNPFKEEVVDLKKFTDYYEETNEENGGISVLADNFYKFEKEYNFADLQKTTVAELKPETSEKEPETNNSEKNSEITKEEIETKQEVAITEKPLEESKPIEPIKKCPEKKEYIVKEGDTISEIATINGMTMEMLLANNPGISVKNLKIGQKLIVVSENGIFYKVEKGDSLYKISSKFKVKVDDILAYNDIDEKSLKIGESIFLKNPDLKVLNKSVAKKTGSKKKTVVATAGFKFPVEYRGINSPYGSRFHPVLKRYIFHSGVDLKARYVPLRAAQSGRVSFAGYMSGYGKIIILKHSSGYETRYAHLEKIGVKVGQNVNKGELIGKTGMSGRVTGPHLHFEIRKNGRTQNPMALLGKK